MSTKIIFSSMRFLIMAFCILILTGCGGGKEMIAVNLNSDQNSNGGNAVVVRVYQLTSYKGGLLNRMERYADALECYEKALQTQEKQGVQPETVSASN